jgi:RNA-directed DNA polymerase
VQQAILQVLEPIFEEKFSNRSHGFRKERGCASALDVVDRAVRHGYGWVVDADIQSFFDTVDHEKLLTALNEEIADGSVLRLIRRILEAGVSMPETAAIEPTELGTPRGGPLSPLLANVYLHALDVVLTQAGYGLVRCADDFVLFARSESEAHAALELARETLEGRPGLRLHPEKTRVVTVAQGFEFLGFHYFADPKSGKIRKEVRRKSLTRFREAIRPRTRRLRNQRKPRKKKITWARLARNERLKELIQGVNRYLEGWHWYFKQIWSYASYFERHDQFIRRRIRTAITGRTGSGWWNQRIPSRMLRDLGLLSLEELNAEYRQDPCAVSAREGRPDGEPYAGKPHVRFGRAGGGVTAP